jgi:hypothetical protein
MSLSSEIWRALNQVRRLVSSTLCWAGELGNDMGLSRGENHKAYLSKRMRYDRCVISIPVGYRYRLLLLAEHGSYTVIDIMSHERYNNIKTIQRRVKQVKRNWSH